MSWTIGSRRRTPAADFPSDQRKRSAKNSLCVSARRRRPEEQAEMRGKEDVDLVLLVCFNSFSSFAVFAHPLNTNSGTQGQASKSVCETRQKKTTTETTVRRAGGSVCVSRILDSRACTDHWVTHDTLWHPVCGICAPTSRRVSCSHSASGYRPLCCNSEHLEDGWKGRKFGQRNEELVRQKSWQEL